MSIVERIEQSIEGFEASYEQFDDTAFGSIAEYTVTVHKKLLKEVIQLLKAVVVAPDLFVREFSTHEMERIAGLAESLIGNPYDAIILNDDNYRPLISRMRVVFGERKAVQYKSEIDKLQELMVRVEDMLKKEKHVSSMQESIDGINAQLSIITDSQNQAQAGLEDVQNKNAEVVNVLESVNVTSEDIKGKHPAIVELFGEIERYQKDMQTSQTEGTEFVQKMKDDEKEYSKERGNVLEAAKNMLGLSNAAGLADAFNQRIDKENEKNRKGWLRGAGFFIMVTMLIAAALYYYNKETEITLTGTLARMSITAIPLLAAWFCGAQYLKLERTLEDYQYKKALAQSMPAFMKQLGEGNDEYRRAYLFLAFQQMLQDPLRKQRDVPSPLKDLFEKIFEKTPKSTKPENPNDTP